MQGTLWPYERPGVLSHETALSLYELSDVDPAKVHITVPANFRIQRKVPDYLVIYRVDLPDADVARLERMPITTPGRTIRDCIAAHLGPALIGQAIEEGHRAGLLEAATVAALERELRAATSGEGTNPSGRERRSTAGGARRLNTRNGSDRSRARVR